jgi:1-deoxy-D-xylulose-5-phosphate reductoisomerase
VKVAIAGSTGSIGVQTVDVVRAERDRFQVVGLSAGGSKLTELIAQARELRPKIVAVTDPAARGEVADALPFATVVDDPAELAAEADVVVNGIVGFAGLPVTMATLRAGRRLALANKESLIAAGPIVQPLRRTSGAELIPVDSEHCAVHQCLRSSAHHERELARIVLTASGGPFRGRTAQELAAVTVEAALAHPTWRMGPKITVDSSTLMNKGFEVIEAHELFGTPYDQIDVVVHPQSIVHSMVEFTDGATVAQLSLPDMRLPIGYALSYPERITTAFGRIDWSTLGRLDFEPPDRATFRCLGLAYAAGRLGGTAPAWLNAANEVVVAAFLDGLIPWILLADVLERVLSRHDGATPDSLAAVIEADRQARRVARDVIEKELRR